MKIFFFILFYLLSMVATYFLSLAGSNCFSSANINPYFYELISAHIICYVIMIFSVCKFTNAKKYWILPFLAGVFDLLPIVNLIPLIPTILNLACLVVGCVYKGTKSK